MLSLYCNVCLLQQYYEGNVTASINQSSYKWKVMTRVLECSSCIVVVMDVCVCMCTCVCLVCVHVYWDGSHTCVCVHAYHDRSDSLNRGKKYSNRAVLALIEQSTYTCITHNACVCITCNCCHTHPEAIKYLTVIHYN